MNRSTIAVTTIFAAIALSATAFAEQDRPDGSMGMHDGMEKHGMSSEQFEKMKSKMLENYKKRVEILQHGESCIQAATDAEHLKTCHMQERASDDQLREQMESERKEFREQRKEKVDKR